MKKNVLIIDPDPTSTELLLELLRKKGFQLFTVSEGSSALDFLKNRSFSFIFSDLAGIRFLERRGHFPTKVPLIYLASDREQKMEGVFAVLHRPLKKKGLALHLDKIMQKGGCESIPVIAESRQMKEILIRVKKIASSHSNIFIIGESGTGKEVIASQIHVLSKRAAFPFIKVNCAALPDTLIESEFFGHEKGAFTGAHSRRIGRFERAVQGTLLLDEISEIPAPLQAKLLRVIQEQEFERLGGTDPLKVDVRLISTSNQNMKEALQEKKFREDLYYRLNVIPIFLPPLRERVEDILPLTRFFLREICTRNQLTLKTLSLEVEKKLINYPWPGNVRELRNVIEHSIVMESGGEIGEIFFDPSSQIGERLPKNSSPSTLKELEKEHILAAMVRCDHHQGKSAKELGISVRTLRNKLKLYRDQDIA